MHPFSVRSRGATIGAFVVCVAVFVPASAGAQGTDAMLTSYITALNAGMPPEPDPEAIAERYAENALHHHAYGDPPYWTDGPHQKGRAAIAAFFDTFGSGYEDWTHVETRRTLQGRRAIWEGVAQGTHKETGKRVEVPIVFSIEFDENGLIEDNLVYVNGDYVARQLK